MAVIQNFFFSSKKVSEISVGGGGVGGGAGSANNYVDRITFDDATGIITLDRQGLAPLATQSLDTRYRTDAQTLFWDGGSGEITISDGNTIDIDGRYALDVTGGYLKREGSTALGSVGTGNEAIFRDTSTGNLFVQTLQAFAFDGTAFNNVAYTNVNNNFSVDQTFGADVTITGDLTVNGTNFITNTETVEVKDNLLIINNGETGSGVTAGAAGIEVDRGTATNYQFLFQESSGLFKIGTLGNLQAVATRQDSVTDGHLFEWNASANRMDGIARSSITVGTATNALSLGGTLAADYALKADYVSSATLTTTLADYVLTTALNTALLNYLDLTATGLQTTAGAITIGGALVADSINTGQGVTEVHLMNQNLRTTDDVTFDIITATEFSGTATNALSLGGVIAASYATTAFVNAKNVSDFGGYSDLFLRTGNSALGVSGVNDFITIDGSGNLGYRTLASFAFDPTAFDDVAYKNINNNFTTSQSITGNLTTTGTVTGSGGVKVTGFVVPAGSGPEIQYASGSGRFTTYNRSGGVYLPTIVDGLTVSLYNAGSVKLATTSTGIAVTGNLTATGTVTATSLNLTGAGGGVINNVNGNLFLQTPAGAGWIFRNGASGYAEYMRITSTGDVGIGVSTSLQGELNVGGNAGGDPSMYIFGSRGSADNLVAGHLTFRNVANGVGDVNLSRIQSLTGTGSNQTQKGQLAFSTNDGSNLTERMRIDSSGNVGIGTSSPQAILNNFSTSARGIAIANGYPMIAFSDTGNASYKSYIGTDSGEFYVWNAANNSTIFATNGTERMHIDSSGNVNITGGGDIIMGISSGTGNKSGSIFCDHWNSSEEKMTGIGFSSTSTLNQVLYGGGTSQGNTATTHRFYVASNNVTLGGGVEKVTINNTGLAVTGNLTVNGAGNTLLVEGDINVEGNYTLDGVQFFTADASYHQIKDKAGRFAIQLGGTNDPSNYYDNTTHYFRSRFPSVTFATLNSTSLTVSSAIKTAAPSGGTAKTWKLGNRVVLYTVALDTEEYVEVEIEGHGLVKLAVVNTTGPV